MKSLKKTNCKPSRYAASRAPSKLLIAYLKPYGMMSQLARQLDVGHETIRRWRDNGVPAERAPDVAAATGMTVAQIRPDFSGFVQPHDQ